MCARRVLDRHAREVVEATEEQLLGADVATDHESFWVERESMRDTVARQSQCGLELSAYFFSPARMDVFSQFSAGGIGQVNFGS